MEIVKESNEEGEIIVKDLTMNDKTNFLLINNSIKKILKW